MLQDLAYLRQAFKMQVNHVIVKAVHYHIHFIRKLLVIAIPSFGQVPAGYRGPTPLTCMKSYNRHRVIN